MKTTFELFDPELPRHCVALTDLLNHYMADPMGDHPPLNAEEQEQLLEGLASRPYAFVLFVLTDGVPVGMATCYELFSTFLVKPYLYIHDVVIRDTVRGKGLGRKLLEELIRMARERGYGKVTLEVREDNRPALELYRSLGFRDTEPAMYFWTKKL